MKNAIIVLAGPTASGKTAMAIELAKEWDGEIINADSRSIYAGMDLGTGKPIFDPVENNTKDIMQNTKAVDGIPHHLFDVATPDQTFSFMQFKAMAKEKIAEIQNRGKTPIIVGGTGLYIDSLVYDFEPAGEADWVLQETLEKKEAELLYGMLRTFDPETAKTIDPKNKRRVIRALEIFEQTRQGKIAQEKKKTKPKNVLYLALDVPREKLYENINTRIDTWLGDDFETEVKNLLKKYPLTSPGMNAIGYKQIALYLTGDISKIEAVEKWKQGERNLAKRQMTWLKRNKDIVWIKDIDEARERIKLFCR